MLCMVFPSVPSGSYALLLPPGKHPRITSRSRSHKFQGISHIIILARIKSNLNCALRYDGPLDHIRTYSSQSTPAAALKVLWLRYFSLRRSLTVKWPIFGF